MVLCVLKPFNVRWRDAVLVRTALLAIIGFMPTHGNGAIGSLDYTPDERKLLARKSVNCVTFCRFLVYVFLLIK